MRRLVRARIEDEVLAADSTLPAEHRPPKSRRRVVLVTGLSGAGRGTSLNALEDMGYEAVDNLPLGLLDNALELREGNDLTPIAVGFDVRTRNFDVPAFAATLEALRRRSDLAVKLLFLDCDNDVLVRRYTQTRRRHPLAGDRPVMDGIVEERRHILPLRRVADVTIDTSQLTPADLKRILEGHFAAPGHQRLGVFVVSFSFGLGLPREADLVFDARFLRNPHYSPDLQPLSGRDRPVQDYIEADADFGRFMTGVTELLLPLLPRYEKEGKSYLTVAVGCTGGRHRSVFVAERLAQWLADQGVRVTLRHRDVDASRHR